MIENMQATDSMRSRRNAELQPPVIREESRKIRKPVVIHLVSPTVIHADAGEFMALVQRLTGRDSSAADIVGGSSGPAKAACFQGRKRQLPVRVKARALKPVGKETSSSCQPSVPPALFLSDLSPPWSGVAELIAADHPLVYSSKF
ncbi:uncharacterized protein LOC103983333 [Musa acuminata AAA Group]|uniref:uncharacterized protein LOC103983333 n=1 Tax=Musa acuminata AAA Group TaxID=214697 RepID=UPI0031E1FEBB